MRIIHIGAFPPPVGGITYFLKRLKEQLDMMQVENDFYDISGVDYEDKRKIGLLCAHPAKVFCSLLFKKKSIVVFNSTRTFVFIAANMLRLRHKTIIILHGEGLFCRFLSCGKMKQKLILFLLNGINGYVCTTDNISNKFHKVFSIEKTFTFLPFLRRNPNRINPIIDDRIFALKSKCNYVIFFYQYHWNMHNGVLLYGADLVVDVLLKLNTSGFITGLIFLCPNQKENEHFKLLCTKLNESNLLNKVVFVFESIDELDELYKISDVHIRATNTDGGAITIYESLLCGTPVIASDCVPRLEGSILFRNRDAESLYEITKDVFINLNKHKLRVQQLQMHQQDINELLNFYERIYNT